jgi:hypothetical protein
MTFLELMVHSRIVLDPGGLPHHECRTGTRRRSRGWELALERTRTAGTEPGHRRTPSCFFYPSRRRVCTAGQVVLLYVWGLINNIVGSIYISQCVLLN